MIASTPRRPPTPARSMRAGRPSSQGSSHDSKRTCLAHGHCSICIHFYTNYPEVVVCNLFNHLVHSPHTAAPRPAPIGAGPWVIAAWFWEGVHAPGVLPLERFLTL